MKGMGMCLGKANEMEFHIYIALLTLPQIFKNIYSKNNVKKFFYGSHYLMSEILLL
jgi:hypothetical protein